MQETSETLLEETSELLNRLMPVVERSINALQSDPNPLLQHLIRQEVEDQENLLQQVKEIKRRAQEYLDRLAETANWTAEKFRELISDERHRAVYEQRGQIDSLAELGADLINFVEENQWELTHRFQNRHFGFYFGRRLVFGINLHAQIPRLCVWIPEGDVIDMENDYINRGVMNHRHEIYYSSSSCAVYPSGVRVADIEEMLAFAYAWRSGELHNS